MSSQPTSELGGDTVDDAFAALQARKSEQEQPEQEEAEEEEDQEELDTDSEPEEETAEEQPTDWDPEYDLGEIKATKSQILAWKAGEMKDADYRQKTTAAAEKTRQAEQVMQYAQNEIATRIQHLDVLTNAMQRELIGDQAKLEELIRTNPAEYVAQKYELDKKANLFQQALQQRQATEYHQQQLSQQSYAQYVAVEEQRLLERMPTWKDPAKAAAVQTEIAQSLTRDYGYTSEELEGIADHRALLVAHDAMLWRKHVSGQKQAQPKVPPAAVKSGNPNQSPVRHDLAKAAEKRLQRSGSIEDAMAVLQSRRK